MATPSQPIVTGRHACTIGLRSLFKILNDRTPVGKEARRSFESTRTSLQCQRVLQSKDICWLCGNGFGSADPKFAAQCEHVLPIAQGIIFLDLYSARSGDINEAMKLEYEWAHATCNNLKNDTVLITEDSTGFIPDDVEINNFLSKLRSKVPVKPGWNSNIKERMTKVTTYINAQPDFAINAPGRYCPTGRQLVFEKVGGKTFKRKSNGISSRSNKYPNRKTTISHRKRRTSNRGRAKTRT